MSGPANYSQPCLPFVRDSDTSVAAAESMRDLAPAARGRIYAAICLATNGLTGDEIEARLKMKHQSVGPRIKELRGQGKPRRVPWPVLIVGYGSRLTRGHRPATVWYAVGREPKGASDAGTE